jgi:hypothetical protein
VTPESRDGAVTVAYVHNADGKNLAHSWHYSLTELIGWDLAHEGRILRGGYIAMKHGTDGLADARNKAVRLFLAEGKADWLFWVDTDMGFAADTVDRLLAAADPVERPVVGALAFTWREDSQDGMGGWRTSPAPTIFDWRVLADGQMGFVVRLNYQPDALTACAGTGSACILVHRSVFERLAAATFGEGKAPLGEHWYDRVPNTTTGQLVSEDLSLCLRAGALGIPVHVHTGVKTTHQKTLWVSEDDYMAARLLAALPPPVPAATEATAVIVPVLGRPGSAAPFMASLKASGAPLAKVYAVANVAAPDADDETVQAWIQAGATVVGWEGGPPGTFAEKVNLGYRMTEEPWLLLVGDDVRFHRGWLDHAQHAARDGADVVGTNDMHNPRCAAGGWSPHPMIRRAYIDEIGASWDGPKVVCHEGYRHNFPDDEIAAAAAQRGAWAFAAHAKVEALHPMWGNAPDDATYALGREHVDADRALFEQRCRVNL